MKGLQISDEGMWMVIILTVGVLLTVVFLGILSNGDPGGFVYSLFRRLWYDMMYYFGGPRIVEV
ncbi:MAG: hypothetical protein V1887_00980 [Candidatus Aenigmatarchaeota archaeon]